MTKIVFFSVYKAPIKNTTPLKNISLEDLFKVIISLKYKAITEALRQSDNKGKQSKIKANELDYVTFSGIFSKRDSAALMQHSNLFCIDIDDLTDLVKIKQQIIEVLPPSLMFVSPSGKGLKVIYRIDITASSTHFKYFRAFESFFISEMNIEIDEKCKDIPRACFLCYDPATYYNKDADVLDTSFLDTFYSEPEPKPKTKPQPKVKPIKQPETITDYNEIMDRAKVWLDKNETFMQGNRNKYVTRLAAAYNRYGIPQSIAESNLLNFAEETAVEPFTEKEIEATVRTTYKKTNFHNVASFEKEQQQEVEPEQVEVKEKIITPFLPIEWMPQYLQDFIDEYTAVYKIPRDYIAASVLFSTAFAIGNKFELKGRYDNIPLLWMAIVGNVSSGKTDPLKQCLSYFTKMDGIAFRDYKIKLSEFIAYEKLSKKEKDIADKVDRPFYFQYLLNDYTPEALYNAHTVNNRGICIYRDELKGWLDDFGRYSKSGEQSTMLSTYYRQPMQINRATKEPINIENPAIYVAGGIQPGILKDLAKDSRAENGFLSRIMFCYPDLDDKQYYSNNKLSDESLQNYHSYLSAFTSIKKIVDFRLSDEAEAIYSDWFNKNADITNKECKGYLKGVYGKLDVISLRLAIVVQGMDFVCNQNTKPTITADSMKAAIKLIEYFRASALKVYNKIFIDNAPELNKKDVAKYCHSLGASQNQIASAIKVTQQYVNKILK